MATDSSEEIREATRSLVAGVSRTRKTKALTKNTIETLMILGEEQGADPVYLETLREELEKLR